MGTLRSCEGFLEESGLYELFIYGVNDGRVMASGGGGVATEKTEKTSPKFEIRSSVRFFFRFFSWYFFVFLV